MKYSVTVPVFNEDRRLPRYFPKLIKVLGSILRDDYEIILVNDGSNDNTGLVINNLEKKYGGKIITIHLDKNYGKGYAIKTGFERSRGDFLFFTDSDLSVDLEKALPPAIKSLEKNDVVITSRRLHESKILIHQEKKREFMGSVYTFVANKLLLTNYSDLTCGFKGFKKDAGLMLFRTLLCPRWSYDAEILYKAKRFNMKIAEIPAEWTNDSGTKVRLSTDIIRSFADLFKIRFQIDTLKNT